MNIYINNNNKLYYFLFGFKFVATNLVINYNDIKPFNYKRI